MRLWLDSDEAMSLDFGQLEIEQRKKQREFENKQAKAAQKYSESVKADQKKQVHSYLQIIRSAIKPITEKMTAKGQEKAV